MSMPNNSAWSKTNEWPAEKRKPGPKGKVLEPYAEEILIMARKGNSMQCIANWLAEKPRCVIVTRQAVHCWLHARIRKLEKLHVVFANTGIHLQLQTVELEIGSRRPEQAKGHDPPFQASARPWSATNAKAGPTAQKHDISEFLVNEVELSQEQNPLITRGK